MSNLLSACQHGTVTSLWYWKGCNSVQFVYCSLVMALWGIDMPLSCPTWTLTIIALELALQWLNQVATDSSMASNFTPQCFTSYLSVHTIKPCHRLVIQLLVCDWSKIPTENIKSIFSTHWRHLGLGDKIYDWQVFDVAQTHPVIGWLLKRLSAQKINSWFGPWVSPVTTEFFIKKNKPVGKTLMQIFV